MKILIDENKLSKSNMTVQDTLVLYLLNQKKSLSEIIERLQKAGFVIGFDNDNIMMLNITETGKMILSRLLESGDDEIDVFNDAKRLLKIAEAIRELYPSGMKKDDFGNDSYPWRGSIAAIADRLKKFERNYYHKELDFNDAVEATKRYVAVHKKKDPILMREMRLLKYFIYKDGESDLLEYLETEAGEDIIDESNGMTIL